MLMVPQTLANNAIKLQELHHTKLAQLVMGKNTIIVNLAIQALTSLSVHV